MKNSLKILLTALMFAASGYSVSAAYAETPPAAEPAAENFDSDIRVSVNGLVCDFCARALEKVFGKRDEVNSINVDLDNSLVEIDIKDGQTMPDEDIKNLITDAGYNVVEITHLKAE